MPFGVSVPLYIHRMTITSTAPSVTEECGLSTETEHQSLVTELEGTGTDISMMIGIGLVKDSQAVYFQYLGDDRKPSALVKASGNPLTRIANVKLTGIAIAEDVGEYKTTKLNLFLTTDTDITVMVTCGLTTYWSQSVLGGLIRVWATGNIERSISIDTWRGTKGKMKPCFAAVRLGSERMSDNEMYQALTDARLDGNKQLTEELCRDAVGVLSHAINPEEAEIVVEELPQISEELVQQEF